MRILLYIWQLRQVRPSLAINFHTAKMEMYCVCQSSHSFAHSAIFRDHNVHEIVHMMALYFAWIGTDVSA